MKSRDGFLLLLTLVLALALRVGLALAYPSVYRPDEIFQTLEPAYSLWKGWGVVSWEWRDGIRSWMFPGFLAGIMAMTDGLGPSVYLALIAAVMSVLSLAVVGTGVVAGWQTGGRAGATICAAAVLIWPDLLFFAPRTLLEVQAGHLLIAAVGLWMIFSRRRKPRWLFVVLGVLLGLCFCLRVQLAPAVALVAVWVCRMEIRRCWLPMLLGASFPLLALGIIDWASLGTPFQSIWKYFFVNLVEGRSNRYGTEPFYWYLLAIFRNCGFAVIPLFIMFIYGIRSLPLAAATATVIILSHSMISHKEASFIYPAECLIVIIASVGSVRFLSRLRPSRTANILIGVPLWILIAGSAALSGAFPFRWQVNSDYRTAFSKLHGQSDMCGLVAYEVDLIVYKLYDNANGMALPTLFHYLAWPPYVFLDRPVPTFLPLNADELDRARRGANYILTKREFAGQIPNAKVEGCSGDICWLHSPTGCEPVPDLETNAVLLRKGA